MKQSLLPESIRNLIKSQFSWDFIKDLYSQKSEINSQIHSFGSIDVNNYYRALDILKEMQEKFKQTDLHGQELRDKYESLIEISEELYELIPMVHNPIGPLIMVDEHYIR